MSPRVRPMVVLITAGLALSGCFGHHTDTAPNPAISRINSETDCTVLQGEFDTAETNGHTDYMTAADKRMKDLGCYK